MDLLRFLNSAHLAKHSGVPLAGFTKRPDLRESIVEFETENVAANASCGNVNKRFTIVCTPASSLLNADINVAGSQPRLCSS